MYQKFGDQTWVAIPTQFLMSITNLLFCIQALIIFAFGNILQYHSHSVLASLGRKTRGSGSRASPYKIPRGGAFELVSCPHYLAEIIVYIGLSCYQIGHNTRPWLIVIWVVRNACEHVFI